MSRVRNAVRCVPSHLPLSLGVTLIAALTVWNLAMRSHLPLLTVLFALAAGLLLMVVVRVQHSLRALQARFSCVLEISAEAVISMDAHCKVTSYNRAARTMFGYTAQEAIGQSLSLLMPELFHAIERKHVTRFEHSEKSNLLMSDRQRVVARRKDGSELHMAASVSQLEIASQVTFTVICSEVTDPASVGQEFLHRQLEQRVREIAAELEASNRFLQEEIAERKRTEDEVHSLSRRMMRVQEEERRKLARELHDGTTQILLTLSLNIARMRRAGAETPIANATLGEWIQLVEDCTHELSTISYLLHPPLLEELGLSLTLRSFVAGFTRRSGIAVTLNTIGRLDQSGFDVELAVFRILQEALSNVHRHSHSSTAAVLISSDGRTLTLEIADHGCGIPAGTNGHGLGLASIRERVRLLKGSLEIETGVTGTKIMICLPLSDPAATSSFATYCSAAAKA